MNYFEFHLAEHCNLKCQSCNSFSSIADEEFLSPESFNKDMHRMSELYGY